MYVLTTQSMSSYYSGASGSTLGKLTAYNCSGQDLDLYYWLPRGEGSASWGAVPYTLSAGSFTTKHIATQGAVYWVPKGAPGPSKTHDDTPLGLPNVVVYSISDGPMSFCITNPHGTASECNGCNAPQVSFGPGPQKPQQKPLKEPPCTTCGGPSSKNVLMIVAVLLGLVFLVYLMRK